MNPNCDACMYQAGDRRTCMHEGPCRGDVQSTGMEHYFHEFTFDELNHGYEVLRTFQLTELLIMKMMICNVIKEWYDGEKGKN